MNEPGTVRRFAGALFTVALLGGCATPQLSALLEREPDSLPVRAELVDTPFFAQDTDQCGPASLAAVLAHAERPVPPEVLRGEVYLPAREGTLQVEMLAASRRRGLVALTIEPNLEHLLIEVAAGTPVVVLQNLSLAAVPIWHYAVVIGYDLEREEIVLRSGLIRRLVLSLSTFERTWARSGHWAMLALAPPRLPAAGDAGAYVRAAVALERVHPRAAREAYTAALVRWPDHLLARIALGNAAYATGDLAGAAEQYQEAIRRHPRAADAWNNLSQTLIERGDTVGALEAVRRAIAIGGPRRALYESTLQELRARR